MVFGANFCWIPLKLMGKVMRFMGRFRPLFSRFAEFLHRFRTTNSIIGSKKVFIHLPIRIYSVSEKLRRFNYSLQSKVRRPYEELNMPYPVNAISFCFVEPSIFFRFFESAFNSSIFCRLTIESRSEHIVSVISRFFKLFNSTKKEIESGKV